HEVKQVLHAELWKAGKWSQDLVWRYPLPDNLGLFLEIDCGNVVKEARERSAAAEAGLKAGDVLRRLGGVPIHSFADVQFALDIAPKAGSVEIVWQRGEEVRKGRLTLPEGWRKSDISWRPSMREFVPQARLFGTDLTAEEKKALGLPEKQLAF